MSISIYFRGIQNVEISLFFLQSPRNGEDLSDAENNSHDEGARESASPEDGHGQVRVKVRKQN